MFVKIWQLYGIPEPIYARWVRRGGDAFARARALKYRQHILAQQAAAQAAEERYAARAHRQGPQITPDNGIGAEIQYEISPWTYQVLHNNSKVEKGCEGGEYLKSADYMAWWLKRNERNQRRTAAAPNKIGYNARLEQAFAQGHAERLAREARVANILQTAALSGRGTLVQ